MNITYKNNYALVNGMKFLKENSGYYISTKIYKNNRRIRLHRYIWEQYNGEIPKDYEIHHIDHNKDNNDISNLEMLTKEEHKKRHNEEISDDVKEKYRINLEKNARPKAIEWHKSNKGKEWHKEQYKNSLGKLTPKEMICEYCGKHYLSMDNGKNRFCSNNCKSAYRRKMGIDNINRICIVCGNEFIVNKYSKKVKCDNCKKKV